MPASKPVEICFVCLGNICRSPLAEGVFQDLVNREGLESRILVHSAGTGNWHVGAPPDARMQATAQTHGIRLQSIARQFQPEDFKRYQLILPMDQSNLTTLKYMGSPRDMATKVKLFRSFDPGHNGDLDVPDPYYGGSAGFQQVFDIVQRTCPHLLEFIKREFLNSNEG